MQRITLLMNIMYALADIMRMVIAEEIEEDNFTDYISGCVSTHIDEYNEVRGVEKEENG